jgi:uncharacterized membrane protein YccF (DUF307 family)
MGRPGGVIQAILNMIWLVLCGLWMAILYVLAGLLAFALIITIPFGIAAFRIAGYVLWPFGRMIEPRQDAGAGALIGNIVWIIVLGWWLALGPHRSPPGRWQPIYSPAARARSAN